MTDLSKRSKIFVAGHRGLVGSAIVRCLQKHGFNNLLLRTHAELDLEFNAAVDLFFDKEKPEYVIIAAAKVGGISANIAEPVQFLVENLDIQRNVLLACHRTQVIKTVFLGSSCIYPREAPQPMREEYFMKGPLEPTNESYAIAKIMGIRLAHALRQQYGTNIICPMPANVYGPGDHFELGRSHVVSALVRRLLEAKRDKVSLVTLWGTGNARRELLHVNDLADACLFLLKKYDLPDIINVGTGEDITIRDLSEKVAGIVGYKGKIEWDLSKPDGMPRKLMDVSRLHSLGWRHQIDLEAGIRSVVADYKHLCHNHSMER